MKVVAWIGAPSYHLLMAELKVSTLAYEECVSAYAHVFTQNTATFC